MKPPYVDINPPAPVYNRAEGPEPRFKTGQAVRIKTGSALGHIRTPHYLRGKQGVIERICGHFNAPERLAYRHYDMLLPLYRVRLTMAEIWETSEAPDDTLDVEIFEHWLEVSDAT